MTTYTLFRLSDRQAQKELATQRRYMQRHRAISIHALLAESDVSMLSLVLA